MIRFSTFLTAAFSILLLAMPVQAQAPRGAVTDLSKARDQAFVSDRIHVEVRGRQGGPDIILIPGLASTAAVWSKLAPALEGQYRLHLVTVRGFGEYAAEGNAQGHISTAVSDDVRRYMRENNVTRPILIGHSMGGQIALRIAADEGDAIRKLMIVDSSPFFPALINRGATQADVEPLARVAYQGILLLGDDMLRTGAVPLGIDLGGEADRVFKGLGWQGGDRRVLAQGVYEVLTTDLRHRLPAISAPVTVVYGWSADASSPRAVVDDLFRYSYMNLRQPARFERIRGAEHMVMIDRPAEFERAVKTFLR